MGVLQIIAWEDLCERFHAGEIDVIAFVTTAEDLGKNDAAIACELRRGRINPSIIGFREMC